MHPFCSHKAKYIFLQIFPAQYFLYHKNETINLMQEENKVFFYDINFNILKENDIKEKDIDSTIISSLIALAPKFVNIYSSDKFNGNLIKLLKQIFDKRINFLNIEKTLEKNN